MEKHLINLGFKSYISTTGNPRKPKEKHQESFEKALSHLRIADHITYVTYPVMKDKRLLLKALDSCYESAKELINSILQYDYLFKRIQLYSDSRLNFDTFITKCSHRLFLNQQELQSIINLIKVVEQHKKSPIEFQRKEKIVIMSDNLNTTTIDLDKIKEYLNTLKSIIAKSQEYFRL